MDRPRRLGTCYTCDGSSRHYTTSPFHPHPVYEICTNCAGTGVGFIQVGVLYVEGATPYLLPHFKRITNYGE